MDHSLTPHTYIDKIHIHVKITHPHVYDSTLESHSLYFSLVKSHDNFFKNLIYFWFTESDLFKKYLFHEINFNGSNAFKAFLFSLKN